MDILTRTIKGTIEQTVSPMWMMRQAGRYLSEYRKVRESVPDFLSLCFNPTLASRVTLQPIDRFDFDAAIIFSDILVIPYCLGQELWFETGRGPCLIPLDRNKLKQMQQVCESGSHTKLETPKLETLWESISITRGKLAPEKSLIGFCGAPWTVATYMLNGASDPNQSVSRSIFYNDPTFVDDLIDVLVKMSIVHLVGQIRAGANILQIFDSWAGGLSRADFEHLSQAPIARIIAGVKAAHPEIPIIVFARGAALYRQQKLAAVTRADCVSLDWTIDLAEAYESLECTLQGNLDPIVLRAGGDTLFRHIDEIKLQTDGKRHIFNLGHGILPDTPLSNVEALVKRWRS